MPQKSGIQLELAFGRSGEAVRASASAEAPSARRGDERPGASGLMETVCERRNLKEFRRFSCAALAGPCESSIRAMESRIHALEMRKAI